jgi:hypothetical protein
LIFGQVKRYLIIIAHSQHDGAKDKRTWCWRVFTMERQEGHHDPMLLLMVWHITVGARRWYKLQQMKRSLSAKGKTTVILYSRATKTELKIE